MSHLQRSCLWAMANVAVTDCRDGLCRSELWARWIDAFQLTIVFDFYTAQYMMYKICKPYNILF